MFSLDALLGLLFGIEIGVGGYYFDGYEGLTLVAMAVVACTAVAWLVGSIGGTTQRRTKPRRRRKS